MTITVREARPDEHDQVGGLTVEAYEEYAESFSAEQWDDYRSDLAAIAERAGRGTILVAESDGTLVGTVTYYPATQAPGHGVSWRPAGYAYLRALAVSPSARNRGVGKTLTLACVERARAEGAEGIALNTTSVMGVAQALYERLGFRLLHESPSWFPGLRVFSYVLSLSGAKEETGAAAERPMTSGAGSSAFPGPRAVEPKLP